MTTKPDLQKLLDQIDRLDQEATPGPWVHDEHDTNPNMDSIVSTALGDLRWIEVARSINHDTEFIAWARTALPQLAKALRDIMELHKPSELYPAVTPGVIYCVSCWDGVTDEAYEYPCPTVQALTDAMEGGDE